VGEGRAVSVAGNGDALLRDVRELTDMLTADAVVKPLTGRLGVLVSAAVELLGVESVGLSLLDDADQVRTVAYTGQAAKVLERAQEHTLVGPGIDVLTDRATVTVEDLGTDPRYGGLRQEVTDCGIGGVLAVPVRLDGQVVGNLNALVTTPHVWSVAQQRAAEALAGVVGQLLLLAAQADPHAAGSNGRKPVR
jgi:GAF domain-containing protein